MACEHFGQSAVTVFYLMLSLEVMKKHVLGQRCIVLQGIPYDLSVNEEAKIHVCNIRGHDKSQSMKHNVAVSAVCTII